MTLENRRANSRIWMRCSTSARDNETSKSVQVGKEMRFGFGLVYLDANEMLCFAFPSALGRMANGGGGADLCAFSLCITLGSPRQKIRKKYERVFK